MSETLINIVVAETAGDYRLYLTFDDGVEQTVDFRPFLTHSRHPDIRAYLDPEKFSAFRIEYGELVWGDYDLCFPIIDFYRNQLERTTDQEAAA
jgi:hypothetical protein